MSCVKYFGEKDVLVPPAENKTKMENYLTKAGVNHQIIIIKDCGHDMITKSKMNNGAKETGPIRIGNGKNSQMNL